MDGGGGRPRLDLDQARRDEEPLAGGSTHAGERRGRAEGQPAIRGEPSDARPHVPELVRRRQRPHAHRLLGRIAHDHGAQPVHELVPYARGHQGRHQNAPDGGALLPGLLRHVAHDVLQEHRVRLRFGIGVGPENGGVEAVGLDVDPHRVADHRGEDADPCPGVAGAGEGHDVLRAQVIEKVARAPDEQRKRARG